jgi:hypothetical protein
MCVSCKIKSNSKLCYDRQSVGYSILMSGTHWGTRPIFRQLRICWCGWTLWRNVWTAIFACEVKVKVILRPMVSLSWCQARDPRQIFLLHFLIFLDSYGFVHMGRHFWREVGSVDFSCCCIYVFRSLSYLTNNSQSVSQSVCLGIEHPCGTWIKNYFLLQIEGL